MKRQFYEPEIQEQQASSLRGFAVSIGGTYVLLDDVVTVLREYAQTLDDGEHGALIHEVATWLQSGSSGLPSAIEQDPAPFDPTAGETYGVDRIEVYPDDPMALRPRWVARACSSEGDILSVTRGDFNQDGCIADAQRRWPGVNVHLINDASQDTVWEEHDPGGIRSSSSGRRRPSPKRMYA